MEDLELGTDIGYLVEALEPALDFYPLTAPGMPMPGPDFLEQAAVLDSKKPTYIGTGPDKRLLACSPVLTELYKDALYQPGFPLRVQVKGRTPETRFLPGHLWTDRPTGPRPARVMVIGKWPGLDEMNDSSYIAGDAMRLFMKVAKQFGVTTAEMAEWYVTAVIKHPNADVTSNKPPKRHITNCLILLEQELRLVKPDYVLALGSETFTALMGPGHGGVTEAQGTAFERKVDLRRSAEEPESWHYYKLVACIHPAAVLHDSAAYETAFEVGIKYFADMISGHVAAEVKPEINYQLIYNTQHLGAIVDEILAEDSAPAVAIDCEWQGEYPTEPGAWLRTIQFSHKPTFAACIVLRQAGGKVAFRGDHATLVRQLRRLLLGEGHRLVGHSVRSDLPWIQLGLDEQLGLDLIESSGVAATAELTKTEGGFDTMYAAHAVKETLKSYSLDMLGIQFCGLKNYAQDLERWKAAYCKEHKLDSKSLGGYGMCPDEILHPYALMDVIVTQELYRKFNDELLDCDEFGNSSRVPFWMTMRAHRAFLEMEMNGILIDRQRGEQLTATFLQARDELVAKLKKLFNWPTFNPRSAQQCKVALFGPQYSGKYVNGKPVDVRPEGALTLGLRPIKSSGKPSMNWNRVERMGLANVYSPCTDKETLGGLATLLKGSEVTGEADQFGYEHVCTLRNAKFIAHAVTSVLRKPKVDEQDNVVKDEEGNTEYEDGLLSFIQADGRIRTHIYSTKETGRVSNARPNTQAISKRRESSYKSILGKNYRFPMRTMLRATPGYVFVEADFIGAEIAMLAIQAGDEKLIDHVRRANLPDSDPQKYDVHASIAVKAFRLDCAPTKAGLKKVKRGDKTVDLSYLRDVTKTLVFGLAYGRGNEAIVRAVQEEGVLISASEAEAIRQAVLGEYSRLDPFFDACKARVTNPGWIRSCFGRYRRAGRIRTDDNGGTEREFMNFPIQGGIADATNVALENLRDYPARRDENGELKYKLSLQVHDAVLTEVMIKHLGWFVGTHEQPGVLGKCMSEQVPIYQCDLNGVRRPGTPVHYLGIESAVALHWGEKIKKEIALDLRIPLQYIASS
jgi:uracil-DNA glycosylase family 4